MRYTVTATYEATPGSVARELVDRLLALPNAATLIRVQAEPEADAPESVDSCREWVPSTDFVMDTWRFRDIFKTGPRS